MRKAVLSITFDDGLETVYTNALQCMQNRSLPGVVYCISDWVGHRGYLTKTQILCLQNDYGWEIGSHTENHTNLKTQSLDIIEAEISSAYHILTSLGAKIFGIAYPYGWAYDDNVIAIIRRYHIYARLAQETFCQNSPSSFFAGSNYYSLLCSKWDRKTLAEVESEVTNCIYNRSWVIGLVHGINGTNQMDCTTWNRLMNYIKTKVDAGQLLVATVIDALEYCRNTTGAVPSRFIVGDQNQECLDFRRDVFQDITLKLSGKSIANMLDNSGFEDARVTSPILPQYWCCETISGTTRLDSSVTHSGIYSLLLNRTVSTGNMWSYTSDQNGSTRISVPSTAGKIYSLSVWVNTNTTAAYADLAFFNESNWVNSCTATANFKLGWQRISVSGACPSNAKGITIFLYIKKGTIGWAYFDDVMLTDIEVPTPYIASTTILSTGHPNIKIGNNWINYSGTLGDGQEMEFKIRPLFGGNISVDARIAGSRSAGLSFTGTRVLYVDKAWITLYGDIIKFEKLFDNASTKATIYRNVTIQFMPGINYRLSLSNTEGGTFYFDETGNYYIFTASQPHFSYATHNITSASFGNDKLVFTVTVSSESLGTTKILVGSKGKPNGVNGATSWSYDNLTRILTVNVAHSGSQTVQVYWAANEISFVPIGVTSAIIIGIILCIFVSARIMRKHRRHKRMRADACMHFKKHKLVSRRGASTWFEYGSSSNEWHFLSTHVCMHCAAVSTSIFI